MSAVESIAAREAPRQRVVTTRSAFHAGMSVLLTGVVIAGFWPQYYGLLLQGIAPAPLLQHWGFTVHSTASLGWMLLFTAQATLVWHGRTDVHRRLGPYLAAYGVLLIFVDISAGIGIELRPHGAG
jgi:hypothetical protein